jgi:phospholipid/cholesterol/gamma-HCH transport system ATP-binding protein
MDSTARPSAIKVRDVVVGFGDRIVLDRLSIEVLQGEILGFVGGSGSGKSVLIRTIIGLIPKRGGTIEVCGKDLDCVGDDERQSIERRWGVLFQQGALFSALTARQNVQFAMREYLHLPDRLMDEVALTKLAMVGLTARDADIRPNCPAA